MCSFGSSIMPNAFRILKPIQKSSKCVWVFRNTGANAIAKNQTRLAYEDKRDLYCICIPYLRKKSKVVPGSKFSSPWGPPLKMHSNAPQSEKRSIDSIIQINLHKSWDLEWIIQLSRYHFKGTSTSLFGPPVRNKTFTKLWAYFRNAKTRPYAVQRFLDWILFFRVHLSKIGKQVSKCLFQTQWSICV